MTSLVTFPLSPENIQRALSLLGLYGVLVIASAFAYALLSGDTGLPSHFIFLVILTGVSAWGIRARYRWAWALAVLLSTWQSYVGLTFVITYLSVGLYAPLPGQIVVGLVALRTLVLLVLFLLLLLLSDRKQVAN